MTIRTSLVADSVRTRAVVCALLALAVAAAFWPVLHAGFTNYDDELYVTKNPHVRAGLTASGVLWAWTAGRTGNWHPLTWISHMLDASLFGAGPAGPHAVNLILHTLAALLLFLCLAELTGAPGRSAFVAALFAVHPLHVESAAWISERKDVLCAVFWMLTTWAYVRSVRSQRAAWRWASVLCFAIGLTAKPMLVTLPFTLLLLDYWPLRRWTAPVPGARGAVPWRLVAEKAPFFALAALSCVVTFEVQSAWGAVSGVAAFPLSVRLANAAAAYGAYLWKTIWPTGLAVIYPHQGAGLAGWKIAAGVLVLAAGSGAAFLLRRRAPYVLVGWLWYVGVLVPVIGLVQVGRQALADRYTYLPLIGVFVIVAWGARDLVRWATAPKAAGAADGSASRAASAGLALCAAAVVVALAGVAHVQAGYWRDSETLAQRALAVTTNNAMAHDLLGAELEQDGRTAEALTHYREALRIEPADALASNNLGIALAREGRLAEAIALYTAALRAAPGDPDTNNNLGAALAREGRIDEAVERFRTALRARPDDGEAYGNLGAALMIQGKSGEAIEALNRALALAPGAEAHGALGVALFRAGRGREAEEQFAAALRVDPRYAPAQFNWGVAAAAEGRWSEAAEHFAEAVRLDPGNAKARARLADALSRRGTAAP